MRRTHLSPGARPPARPGLGLVRTPRLRHPMALHVRVRVRVRAHELVNTGAGRSVSKRSTASMQHQRYCQRGSAARSRWRTRHRPAPSAAVTPGQRACTSLCHRFSAHEIAHVCVHAPASAATAGSGSWAKMMWRESSESESKTRRSSPPSPGCSVAAAAAASGSVWASAILVTIEPHPKRENKPTTH